MNLVTNLQSTEQIMPPIGSLNDPSASFESRIALAFLLFLSARFDVSNVSPTLGRATQLRVVVAFIAAQMLTRFSLGRRSGDHHRIQGGPESLHVVPVGTRECSRQRDTVGIREIVPFGAQFSAIGRVFSSFVAPLTGAETVAESSDWKCQSMPLRSS